MLIIGASPFLVMNVAILSVCLCLCVMDRHDICFLYSWPFTNFYVKAAHGHAISIKMDTNNEMQKHPFYSFLME